MNRREMLFGAVAVAALPVLPKATPATLVLNKSGRLPMLLGWYNNVPIYKPEWLPPTPYHSEVRFAA